MTKKQAESKHAGDTVEILGARRRIGSIKVGQIAGPHFRVTGVKGLTSYRLCGN